MCAFYPLCVELCCVAGHAVSIVLSKMCCTVLRGLILLCCFALLVPCHVYCHFRLKWFILFLVKFNCVLCGNIQPKVPNTKNADLEERRGLNANTYNNHKFR